MFPVPMHLWSVSFLGSKPLKILSNGKICKLDIPRRPWGVSSESKIQFLITEKIFFQAIFPLERRSFFIIFTRFKNTSFQGLFTRTDTYTDTEIWTDIMGFRLILPVKVPVTIATMLKFFTGQITTWRAEFRCRYVWTRLGLCRDFTNRNWKIPD